MSSVEILCIIISTSLRDAAGTKINEFTATTDYATYREQKRPQIVRSKEHPGLVHLSVLEYMLIRVLQSTTIL